MQTENRSPELKKHAVAVQTEARHGAYHPYGKRVDKAAWFIEKAGGSFAELSKACDIASKMSKSLSEWFDAVDRQMCLVEVEMRSRVEFVLVFAMHDGECEHRIRYDVVRNRWFTRGSSISGDVLDAIEITGFPRAFFDGFEWACRLITRDAMSDAIVNKAKSDIIKSIDEINVNVRSAKAMQVWCNLVRNITDVDRVVELSRLAADVAENDVRRARVAITQAARQLSVKHHMAPPPPAKSQLKHLTPPQSAGIYFCWRNGICVYVGKSVNIASRLRSHNVVGPDDDVSWLLFDKADIHHAELFYIWLLSPCENSETKLSAKHTRDEGDASE